MSETKSMKRRQWKPIAALLAAATVAMAQPAAAADAVADFYKGKQIRVVIGQQAGGTLDLLVRAVIRQMHKYTPGSPSFLPQNMDGAGSRIAANWLYGVAPKDGLVLGSVTQGTAMDQVRGEPGVQFDVAKFNWIGNPLAVNSILLAWTASGIATFDDLKKKGGLICGATGASSPTVINPTVLKNLTGVDLRIISGYGGVNDTVLAMQRGEVNCLGATNLPAAQVLFPTQFKEGKVAILVQLGTDKDPAISAFMGRDVPLISDFATNDADRQVLDLIHSGLTFGRPILAPPGVPAERIEALRRAFDATMSDPDFLLEAKAQSADPIPVKGERLQQLAVQAAATGPEVVARVNELTTAHDVSALKK
jgi:tripartite-type tricarboxylate transporter receptor subunit TctC